MKKLFPFFCAAAMLVSVAHAQTFTQNNSDGVEIQYTIMSDSNVRVVGNNYTGRVVIPSAVTYEAVTYVVNEVASAAFSNCSDLTYIELPSTLVHLGTSNFKNIGLDTLVLNTMVPPTNLYGNPHSESTIKAMFGNDLVLVVPDGALRVYRDDVWGMLPLLQSPSSVPFTLYVPARAMLLVDNRQKLGYNNPATYFTLYAEVGEKIQLVSYYNSYDTLFMGWDKGDVYLTEIVGSDTLYPVYQPVNYDQLDANNISALVKFTGQMSFHDGIAHYYVPANSTNSTVYSTGLWLAGTKDMDGDEMSVGSANRFSTGDFVPGPVSVDGEHRSDLTTRTAFNRLWSVSRAEIDDFIANVGTVGYEIPENILSWPGNGGEGYAEQLAPYYDADSDGVYTPSHGDYPLIRGDKMLFGIFNDNCGHSETGSEPMGVEVHMSAYAFDEPADTALNNTVFISYKIINRSEHDYNNVWVGAFTDFDIGYAGDDYVGCDVKNSMAYGYNGLESDMVYGTPVPAQGTIILGGPYAEPDGQDNPVIDIEKMLLYYPEQLATYQLANGGYDTARLTADADLYYPDAWSFTATDAPNSLVNASVNGMNYGNGIVDDERLGMSKFMYYNNSTSTVTGEPMKLNDYFCYLSGHWKNGMTLTYGGAGTSGGTSNVDCSFMFPGDSDPLKVGTGGIVPSVDPDSWTDFSAGNTPGDRRGVQSCGPFTLAAGTSQTLDLAFVTAFDSERNSVDKLRTFASCVRRQFAHDTTDSGRSFAYMPYSAPITGIAESPATQQVRVYPNPTRGIVTVELGNGTDIDLYDIRGNKVLSRCNANGIVTLDISALPQGVYILRCGATVSRLVKL